MCPYRPPGRKASGLREPRCAPPCEQRPRRRRSPELHERRARRLVTDAQRIRSVDVPMPTVAPSPLSRSARTPTSRIRERSSRTPRPWAGGQQRHAEFCAAHRTARQAPPSSIRAPSPPLRSGSIESQVTISSRSSTPKAFRTPSLQRSTSVESRLPRAASLTMKLPAVKTGPALPGLLQSRRSTSAPAEYGMPSGPNRAGSGLKWPAPRHANGCVRWNATNSRLARTPDRPAGR